MTNISGKYRFNTMAVKDDFRACFLKLSFFQGSTQLSKDEFAQAISGGVWTSFNIYEMASQTRPGSFFDFSTRIEASILVSNRKGSIVFERKINNLLEYSFFYLVNNVYNYAHLLIPGISVVLDIDENDNFAINGMISTSGSFWGSPYDNYPSIPCRGVCIGLDTAAPDYDQQFDFYSFKNLEPIIKIDASSRLDIFESPNPYSDSYGFTSGSTFFSPESILSYIGGGLWANEVKTGHILFSDGSYTTAFNDCSIIHRYPDTVILPPSGLPAYSNIAGNTGASLSANYNIDFGVGYSTTYKVDPVVLGGNNLQTYNPIIKDSKTGNLMIAEVYIQSESQPSITEDKWRLHSGSNAITDFFYNNVGLSYKQRAFATANISSSGMLLYDGLFINIDCKHNKGGKTDLAIKINSKYPLLFDNSLQSENSTTIQLPIEFQEALEAKNESINTIDIPQGVDVYSLTTNNHWRFCNTVILNK